MFGFHPQCSGCLRSFLRCFLKRRHLTLWGGLRLHRWLLFTEREQEHVGELGCSFVAFRFSTSAFAFARAFHALCRSLFPGHFRFSTLLPSPQYVHFEEIEGRREKVLGVLYAIPLATLRVRNKARGGICQITSTGNHSRPACAIPPFKPVGSLRSCSFVCSVARSRTICTGRCMEACAAGDSGIAPQGF